jgi:hypothetical protein
MLTAAWIHRFPIIQKISPAELAAEMVLRTLDEIGYDGESKISIVDFCSGAGGYYPHTCILKIGTEASLGPVPTIEKLVNEKRTRLGQPPIPFLLTDIRPHLDAWIKVCAESDNLSFIPQSVDATDPPIAVVSATSAANSSSSRFSSDTRVFRLYCLSFHHFPDDLARKVLKSTIDTADGFAIIELQDRYLTSLLLICLFFPLQFLTTLFWFWRDPVQLIFTYIMPIVPCVVTFDGWVSCLRTRSFEEVMKLMGKETGLTEISTVVDGQGRVVQRCKRKDWTFEARNQVHTWPLGYMNWIVGYKKSDQ